MKKEARHSDSSKSYNVCIRVQQVGEEFSEYLPCTEMHHIDNDMDDWTIRISCPNDMFYMRPNGHFHKGRVHSDVRAKPADDYKDSLSIFVGKCADITN